MAHILIQHYAPSQKKFLPRKSYHKPAFKLEEINSILLKVFQDIDEAKIYQGQSIEEIYFRFIGIDYCIYCNKVENQACYRIDSFFPAENLQLKQKLHTNYFLFKINEELSVYLLK